MLNEAPNNNYIMNIENMALNKLPNSSGATLVANNMRLTTMDAQQFSMAAI